MAPYATFDTSHAPIVSVRVVRAPDDENYPAYLEQLARELGQHERFALVFDTGDLKRFPAKYREMQARWLRDTRDAFEGRWLAAAFVVPNRAIRGVLLALYWMNPPYYPYRVVGTQQEAWAFVRQELASAGISVAGPSAT